MPQQTLSGDRDPSEKDTERTQNERSSSSGHASENVACLDCDDAVDSWVDERDAAGENFAYSALRIEVKQELADRKVHIGRSSRTERSNADRGIGNLNSSVRSHGFDLSAPALIELLHWRVNLLALPVTVRGIESADIQVFVPDGAGAHLTVPQDWPVESVDEAVEVINGIEDCPGSERFEKLAARYTTAQNRTKRQGPIRTKTRAVEATIRARLDFSTRYGCGTPEPYEEFDHLDLVELREELEAARDELAETENRAARVKEELSDLESERRTRIIPDWVQEQD